MRTADRTSSAVARLAFTGAAVSAAIRSATAPSSSAAGTTRLARPIACASVARTARPVRQISRAREYQAGFRWLRRPGIVSVAAVQGHAIGAGCQLALACDLRILTDDAQLRLPEATLGLVPDLTGTSTLVELVGYSRALEICLTGRAVRATEAHAIGLANLVVPAAALDGAVADLIAALTAAPVNASRATAELVRSAVRNSPAEQDAAERAAQVLRLQELVSGS